MSKGEITHIVKTDNLSKTQLVVKTKYCFCCPLRETHVKAIKLDIFSWKHNASGRVWIKSLTKF